MAIKSTTCLPKYGIKECTKSDYTLVGPVSVLDEFFKFIFLVLSSSYNHVETIRKYLNIFSKSIVFPNLEI